MVAIVVAAAADGASGGALAVGVAAVALVAIVGYGFMREWWDSRP